MAVYRIPLDAGAAEQTISIDLGGATWRLRLRWQAASNGWYADLFDAAGVILQAGRRLSPGYSPFLGLRGPPGGWVVVGIDDAPQSALDTAALTLYYAD